jgi:hypothetical protein
LGRSYVEGKAERIWPSFYSFSLDAVAPSEDVIFLTVADFRFYRGLEALLLSLLSVYPDLRSPVLVFHDGTLSQFLRNRLLSVYPLVEFFVPSVDWAGSLPVDSRNRARIGGLGYLNTQVFSVQKCKRVVVLDSDILIEGALDPLWAEGDSFRLVPDCGVRPWSPVSSVTGMPVLNSGVISVPGCSLTLENQRLINSLVSKAGDPYCPLLDRFADQKIWNQYLAGRSVEQLPVNFNCNSKYLFRSLGGFPYAVSVVHFAGPKPWLTYPWLAPSPDYLRADSTFPLACLYWNDRYSRLLARWRMDLYRRASLSEPALDPSCYAVVSSDLDLLVSRRDEEISFHWLSAGEELMSVLSADKLEWPPYLHDKISLFSELHLWLPFEFEPCVRSLAMPAGLRIHWLLIEAPFGVEGEAVHPGKSCPGEHIAFHPCSEPLVESMGPIVLRRLRQAGCQTVVLSGVS